MIALALATLVSMQALPPRHAAANEDGVPTPLSAAETAFSLITRDLTIAPGLLVEINARDVVFRHAGGRLVHEPIADCLAVLTGRELIDSPRKGMLRLADGQLLPGQSISSSSDSAVLVWNHALLGRLLVPVKEIESIHFAAPAGERPRAAPAPGDADIIVLANGDRLEGFIVSLAGPILLEVTQGEGKQLIEVDLERVAALRMITPRRPPDGQRVWLTDGSVLEARQIYVSDDRTVRLIDPRVVTGSSTTQMTLSEVAGVLLDAAHLLPFAALAPVRVEGPPTRYTVPIPKAGDVDAAPLGLAEVEFRGPLKAWYKLPPGATRFAAEVRLPNSAQRWGDCTLIIQDSGREVFHADLSADHPSADFNLTLHSDELSIEITEASNGPVQDHLVFRRAMLLVSEP